MVARHLPRRWPLRHVRAAAIGYPATARQLEHAIRAAADNGAQRLDIARHAIAFAPEAHKQDAHDLARRTLWTETSR